MNESEFDPRRRFSGAERAALFAAADGRCALCGDLLNVGFHADHETPHILGGRTHVTNGQALCARCNLSKGASMSSAFSSPSPRRARVRALPADLKLRDWQDRALAALRVHDGQAFLIAATPGGGKTIPSLVYANELLAAGTIDRVVVVCPTSNLARQWARDAHRLGLSLEPNWDGVTEPADVHGVAITYAKLTHAALVLARASGRERTLVIGDELHHLGQDKSWASAWAEAFGQAHKWLLLSGTPFRSDNLPIPGVRYDEDGVSRPDFSYTYGQAIGDGVCRAIAFVPMNGPLVWTSDGRRIEADFTVALSAKEAARRHRTSLSPHLADGLQRIVREADERLTQVRETMPDAGGLIVCEEIEHARAVAAVVAQITGEAATLVVSSDPLASERLEEFARTSKRWLVAVNMVSEGTDIPRLRALVYATPKKTPLLFRQICGRVVRTSPTSGNDCSFVFIPADPTLRQLAHDVEREMEHRLEDEDPGSGPETNDEDRACDEPTGSFAALGADLAPQAAMVSGTEIPDPDTAFHIEALARAQGVTVEEMWRRMNGRTAASTSTEIAEEPDYVRCATSATLSCAGLAKF